MGHERSLRTAFCAAALACTISAAHAEPSDPFVSFQSYNKQKSDACYSKVSRGLATIPKAIRESLLENGYSVFIAPTMLSAIPQWEGGTPRGYREDSNYDNVGGLFEPRSLRIVIPESVQDMYRGNKYAANDRAEETVRHEIGHAYDHFQGGASTSLDFIDAYTLDSDKLNQQQQGEFAYFLQPNGAGYKELFAELFAAAYTPDAATDERFERLLKAFPKTTQLIMRLSPNKPGSKKIAAKPIEAKPATSTPVEPSVKETFPQMSLAATYQRISELYKQGQLTRVEPLMRDYVERMEMSGVPISHMKAVYASYADLLKRLHKDNEAQEIVKKASRLGVSQMDSRSRVNPELDKTGVIGLRFKTDSGQATVVDIFPGSPAAAAGLYRGDIIVAIDDFTVTSDTDEEDIYDHIIGTPGTSLSLTVLHGNGKRTVSMKRVPITALPSSTQIDYAKDQAQGK